MLSLHHFDLFETYKDAGSHAFSTGVVSDADKNLYAQLFESLQEATRQSISQPQYAGLFEVWSAKFGRTGGMQGHRPVDLWSSVSNVESEVFGRCPQVYIIASSTGLEIGFSVTIHEDDYYNQSVKQRQRSIVPVLSRKLPDPNSAFIVDLDGKLASDAVWKFGLKTRQHAGADFGSASKLIEFLKSPDSSLQGGGTIYRLVSAGEAASPDFDLNQMFSQTLSRFAPLMRLLVPSRVEEIRLQDQESVDSAASQIPDFDPDNIEDGRRKILRLVAMRQGQAKFREKLLDAYEGCCAITGTSIASILQAAHIVPFRGPETNSVQNGLLLRADIHTLFDLGLLQIDPSTFTVTLSEELRPTLYGRLHGRKIKLPRKPSHHPHPAAFAERLKLLT